VACFTHTRTAPRARQVLLCALVALPVAGCAASAAAPPKPAPASTTSTAPAAVTTQARAKPRATTTTSIDRLTKIAKQRYRIEVHGGQAFLTLHRVARDPALRAALRSGDNTRITAYVRSQFNSVWYHWHVSRLRVLRGTNMLVDVGVPFVVAPAQMTLHGAGGTSLGTLQVSIQDVIGFVRYMHRNYPVDVIARGQGAAHVRTSLPAAANVRLPNSGTAIVAGNRYQVRSFMQTALAGEPVKIWILQRG
jgi:hypothetical protein